MNNYRLPLLIGSSEIIDPLKIWILSENNGKDGFWSFVREVKDCLNIEKRLCKDSPQSWLSFIPQ